MAAVMGVALIGAQIGSPSHTRARTYAASAGQRARVVLPDRSRIILAPRSQIVVNRDFGRATRYVTLIGEAYFEVASSAGAPFMIRTGSVTTRVLGTAFDVRYDSPNAPVTVTVVDGKVSAEHKGRRLVILGAGMVGRVADSTVTVTRGIDAQRYTDWTRGRLEFNETPVNEMLARLGRWYGYEFRLDDSTLATQRVTVVFDGHPASEMLGALRGLLGVTMTFHGTVVTLHSPIHHVPAAPAARRSHETLLPSTEVGR